MVKLFLGLALIVAVAYAQQEVHPCFNRRNGFAPVLNNCRGFWRCEEQPPSRGECDYDRVFNDQTQGCAPLEWTKCYSCNSYTSYRLSSIRGSCQHFARCIRGESSMHICPDGLVFDGRYRNCNYPTGSCYFSNEDSDSDDDGTSNGEYLDCPGAESVRPLFFRARNSCQR